MKLGKGHYEHFGSYGVLDFDFSNCGLSLISGPTGAGKSTLFDAPTWCLFGGTGKGTAADDIRSWGAEGPTTGVQEVSLGDDIPVTVVRCRGRGKNDLYWIENGNRVRGKDLTDTQRLLEERLGVTAELYFSASYFGQFSTADSFFVAKAKERREMFEQIADLRLPSKISDRASASGSLLRRDQEQLLLRFNVASVKAETLREQHSRGLNSVKLWGASRVEREAEALYKAETFEKEKHHKEKALRKELSEIISDAPKKENFTEQLQALEHKVKHLDTAVCDKCGSSTSDKALIEYSGKRYEVLQRQTAAKNYDRLINDLTRRLQECEKNANPHFDRLDAIRSEVNPFASQIESLSARIAEEEASYASTKVELDALAAKLSALEMLKNISLDLRGLLLENVVNEIQDSTNGYLDKYFDGEIKVTFSLDADKLDIELQKNGNTCNFKQLSGGQRCLLKLCFAISMMDTAANKAGQHFDTLFLDEPLHALDGELKVKAFALLQELSTKHNSVLVIEHSEEIKSLFDTKFQVTLEGDHSSIEQS